MTSSRSRLRRIFFCCLCLVTLVPLGLAAEARRMFDVPAGDAVATLKTAAQQGEVEIMFPAVVVQGIRTNVVKGEFTARQALDRMLAGTSLTVVRDEKTGAFAIRREGDEKKDSRRRDERATALVDATIVRLNDYIVQDIRAPGPVNEGVIPRTENRALAFQIYDRAAIENSGANSLGEFFRNYSGNTSSGLGFQSVFGASTNLASGPGDTGDRINLHGLGNSRTVVLLNGRRLYGSDSAGPDISRVPLSAVERVEILSGAGAAIYGANAVGGAVNIITRRNYNIEEITGYLGTSTAGGATEWRGTLYSGFSLDDGRTNGSLVLEHTDRQALRASQRKFYLDALNVLPPTDPLYRTIAAADLRTPRAGITTTAASGLLLPSNPAAMVTAVPVGYRSASPAANDFDSTVGQQPIGFRRPGAVLLQPAATIDSLNFQFERSLIKDRLDAYAELAWRYQVGRNTLPGIGGNASLTATSPLNPFRANPAAGRPVGVAISLVWDPVDVPFDESYTLQRTTRLVGGLKGKLGARKTWAWAVDYSYDRNESYSTYLQRSSSLNDAVTAGIYDPFRDLERYPNTIDLAQLTSLNVNRSVPEIYVGNVRVSGELLEWRAGRVGLSFGGELRREDIKGVGVLDFSPIRRQVNPFAVAILGPTSNGESKASREARAAYAELSVPLVGGSFHLPLVESLEVSLAARHESYGRYSYRSTFGAGVVSTVQPGEIGATPLTAAVLWKPVRDVAFRASYSETFVSPTMSQFFSARSTIPIGSAVTFFDPVLNATVTRPAGSVIATSGGNPGLRPESGRAYNYGVIFTPRGLSGLTASADLFRVVSNDQIRTPAVQTIVSYFPERVGRDAAQNVISYDTSAVNMSQVVVGGADLRLDWQFNAGSLGTVDWQTSATYTDCYKQLAIVGNPFVAGVGDRTLDAGAPLRWKGSSSVTLTRDAWTAGLTARYVGQYKDAFNSGLAVPNTNGGIDGAFIRGQLEYDLRLTYDFGNGGSGWRRWAKGTRVALGALNLFDRRPPYVSTNAGAAFYSYYNDPRMRFVYLEVRKRF